MTYSKFGKRKLQPRLLYPTSLSFRFESETKNFTDKPKLKDENGFQEMIKGLLSAEKTVTGKMKMIKGKILLVKANIK